ncbi:hypothetical protein PDJ82_25145 [Bacillus cereus group sp. TH43LC]|uniref:hypothetical protein n=1 Tax=Bacillus cereus group TaxID=86661 RepID=UPI000BF52A43|nr:MULTISPECIES: hypothetical protein [Bacillus cereus group]MCU5173714.1 hypothetical protein [Bacillus paranthracis]MDA1504866.1 hypothetical protein [Bacillus cereus group sp. TH43LC]MDA1862716.1 hypothetical protein [Bacillus cereus group sp. BY128LC]PFU31222.1 hypothetical protein COK69_21905 [Bacillus cereus]
MSNAPFQPIVVKKENTLNDKDVEIKGTNDFHRNSESAKKQVIKPIINKTKAVAPEQADNRLVPSKTAKLSPAVLLKLSTLKPFIIEAESMDKASNNNIIDMLVDNYVNTKLTTRQSEGYKNMYEQLYEMLEKK